MILKETEENLGIAKRYMVIKEAAMNIEKEIRKWKVETSRRYPGLRRGLKRLKTIGSYKGKSMAFESLADKLQGAFRKLRGKARCEGMSVRACVRLGLPLEADVNFKVVKDFVAKITERAVGAEVLGSLTPTAHRKNCK